MRIEPLGEQVVVAPIEDKITRGGIHLPETAQDKGKLRRGKVLSVGPGKYHVELEKQFPEMPREKVDVKPGDLVLWGQYSGVETELDGVKLVLVPHSEILGIVKE